MDRTVSASLGRRFVSSTLEAGGAPLTVATPAPASLPATAGVPLGGAALPAPESGVTASGPALFGGVTGAGGGVPPGFVFEAVELEPPPANIIQPPTASAITASTPRMPPTTIMLLPL